MTETKIPYPVVTFDRHRSSWKLALTVLAMATITLGVAGSGDAGRGQRYSFGDPQCKAITDVPRLEASQVNNFTETAMEAVKGFTKQEVHITDFVSLSSLAAVFGVHLSDHLSTALLWLPDRFCSRSRCLGQLVLPVSSVPLLFNFQYQKFIIYFPLNDDDLSVTEGFVLPVNDFSEFSIVANTYVGPISDQMKRRGVLVSSSVPVEVTRRALPQIELARPICQ